jgi:flavin-dependent dehydrogenase
VTSIEGGRTNVCGLAPESFLSSFGFEYDSIPLHCRALADRLKPLRRVMPWISTGPLQYGQAFEHSGSIYPVGDALSFVDPFTGSGLLAAVRSGAMAGRAAAQNQPVDQYLRGVSRKFAPAISSRGSLAEGTGRRVGGKARTARAQSLALCSHPASVEIKKPVSTRRSILTGRLTTDQRSRSLPSFQEDHRAVGESFLRERDAMKP